MVGKFKWIDVGVVIVSNIVEEGILHEICSKKRNLQIIVTINEESKEHVWLSYPMTN